MKRCPTCNRTYTDDALSFCLDDGAVLLSAAAPPAAPANFDPNATIAYPAARDTGATPSQPYSTNAPPQQVVPTPQPTAQPMPPPMPPPAWGAMPHAAPPVRKKSSPLPWILGIVGVLLVLGIGAIVMLSIAGGSNSNNSNNNNRSANNSNNTNNSNNSNNSNKANANNSNANNSNNSNSSSTNAVTDDFSTEKWGTGSRAYGSFYSDGEYHMHHTVADQYIISYAPSGDPAYQTDDATVKVTVRSVDNDMPAIGYGLVVHGDIVGGNLQGYAFLIKNGANPQYGVMLLEGGQQKTLIKPTYSSVIRSGTTPNQLEVRISGSQLAFYVNGQYVTSITDSADLAGTDGRVGFYTSTGGEVAFDDLSVKK
jgi:hypothetical protein